jgi:hypothetical protein
VTGINDTHPAVVTYLFTGTTSIKDDDYLMRCVAVAIDELGDQEITGGRKVLYFDCPERRGTFNYVIAIDQDITPHGGILFCCMF